MKTWMLWMGAVWMAGVLIGRADERSVGSDVNAPAVRSPAPVAPAETKPIDTNASEKVNAEIQNLLKEEMGLRGESRTLSTQVQTFAAEMGTNNVVLAKLHQDWRAAQDRADRLRAEMQAQIETSPQYKEIKARRDDVEARLLQIRTRLRELMKDRGIQGRLRPGAHPGVAPAVSRARPVGAAQSTQP